MVEDQVDGAKADPFGPTAVALRQWQPAKDSVKEVGVEAVSRRSPHLPKPIKRLLSARLWPCPADDQRLEFVDGVIVKELGFRVELLSKRSGSALIRREAPEMVPTESAGYQPDHVDGNVVPERSTLLAQEGLP